MRDTSLRTTPEFFLNNNPQVVYFVLYLFSDADLVKHLLLHIHKEVCTYINRLLELNELMAIYRKDYLSDVT